MPGFTKGVGEAGGSRVVFCLLFIGSREGRRREGPSLVVTCSGYFESNKSTLSVLLVLRFAGV